MRREWTFTIEVVKASDGYTARCLEIEAYAQGETEREVLENIKEAIACYVEEEEFPVSCDDRHLHQVKVPIHVR